MIQYHASHDALYGKNGTRFYASLEYEAHERTLLFQLPNVSKNITLPKCLLLLELVANEKGFFTIKTIFGHPKDEHIYPIPLTNQDPHLAFCLGGPIIDMFEDLEKGCLSIFNYFWTSRFVLPSRKTGWSESFMENFNSLSNGTYEPRERINVCSGQEIAAIKDPREESGRFIQRKEDKKLSFVTEKTHYAIR